MLEQPYLQVAIGGLLGANARYLVAIRAAHRWDTAFPYGTLIANVSGSLLLGLTVTLIPRLLGQATEVRLLVAIGFLGAYTTFSTFAFESMALIRQGAFGLATANVVATVVFGLLGAWLGTTVARAF